MFVVPLDAVRAPLLVTLPEIVAKVLGMESVLLFNKSPLTVVKDEGSVTLPPELTVKFLMVVELHPEIDTAPSLITNEVVEGIVSVPEFVKLFDSVNVVPAVKDELAEMVVVPVTVKAPLAVNSFFKLLVVILPLTVRPLWVVKEEPKFVERVEVVPLRVMLPFIVMGNVLLTQFIIL
jgi:hypothetical protein